MTQPTFLDFELEIGVGEDSRYPVTVLHSPAGEASAVMLFPFAEAQLAEQLGALQEALLGRTQTDQQLARTFGEALFNALLAGEIRSRYDVSRQIARGQDQGLRIKLRIEPTELLAVPWEFLYDEREAEFICLSRYTPLVRYAEVPQPIQSLRVQPPLRILGMVVSPNGMTPLDVGHEQAQLEAALAPLRQNNQVELVWLEGQTWRVLQQALQGGPWHVFHYVGHAAFDPGIGEGVLVIADEAGDAHFLRASELARLLDDQMPLRLAVLNACEGARGDEYQQFSSLSAVLVRRGLPATIAMQYEITDAAAIEFTRSFYSALAKGLPVDAAVGEARKAISLSKANSLEWATPVLAMRAPDGVLWQAQREAEKAMSENKPDNQSINTGGGAFIGGSVNTGGGKFVGRDDITHGDQVQGHKAGGDVIVGTVGAGAKNVAIGKNIKQTSYEGVSKPTPDDKPAIQAQFAQLVQALENSPIDPARAAKAEPRLEMLQEELIKVGEDETPDPTTITKMGDWLLDNLPEIAGAVTGLFLTEAVGRVVAKAGEGAVTWARKRFGKT